VSALGRLRESVALELHELRAQLAFVALTVAAALTFLATVSLFGLTGSNLPLALVDEDHGPYVERFVHALESVPHAFSVRRMNGEEATRELRTGRLIGAVTLPAGFTAAIEKGDTVAIAVRVDNLNLDITTDLERALPAAILAFGQDLGLPGLRARLLERDFWPRDTGFLQYISVSALGLDALVIAGALAALAMAREWEGRTLKFLRLAPTGLDAVVFGKLIASASVAAVAMLATTLLVMVGYGVVPVRPGAAAGVLALCIVTFACMGAWAGARLRKTLPIVPLAFGLAMPLYIDSGALEPTRFDGERIWALAHLSPLYYGVGLLEWAFHGLRITPEPPFVLALVLLGLAVTCFLGARRELGGRTGERAT
jgi:ABC-type Na+ efflux pump permease subunit